MNEPEIKRFSDFYHHIINKDKLECPDCQQPVNATIITGFNMNKVGQAHFQCTKCDLKITVEVTG